MRDPLALAVAFNFLALTVVAVLWGAESRRADRLAYELACLRHHLGLPEPQPEPRWWERAREWLHTVPDADEPALTGLAGFSEPADTVESKAVVIGGARVVGRTPAADWVETALEQYRQTGSWK